MYFFAISGDPKRVPVRQENLSAPPGRGEKAQYLLRAPTNGGAIARVSNPDLQPVVMVSFLREVLSKLISDVKFT